jgi:hypothetical protein
MSRTPTVRDDTADDPDAVRRVVTAAYGGEKVADLLDHLRHSVAWLGLGFRRRVGPAPQRALGPDSGAGLPGGHAAGLRPEPGARRARLPRRVVAT